MEEIRRVKKYSFKENSPGSVKKKKSDEKM